MLSVVETVFEAALTCNSAVNAAFIPGIETNGGKGSDYSNEDFQDVFEE